MSTTSSPDDQMLLPMLMRVFRAMNDETTRRLAARGQGEMQPSYPRLFGNIDAEGTRIASLARRIGTTRQAASQLVQEIEQRGFVARHPDPEDKRGVVVRFTSKGRKAFAVASDVMREVEAEYATAMGAPGLQKLKKALASLAEIADPEAAPSAE